MCLKPQEAAYVLDLSGGRIISINPDGTHLRVIVTGCRHPDGIVVDVESGHIYWTDMGIRHLNDGCIQITCKIIIETKRIIIEVLISVSANSHMMALNILAV
jgi:hypothetical protein